MMNTPRHPRFTALLGPAILVAMAGLPSLVTAHEAKSGWMYPSSCCSDRDCREVAAGLVSERPEGYVIQLNGEWLSHSDPRIRHSPDGVFHWCSAQGRDNTRTICLFVPPNGF